MHVIAGFTLIPVGTEVSLSPYVAACERVLAASGLTYELHANGTNLEGDWDAVMAAIRCCHEAVHALGAPRIITHLTIGTRTDREQRMAEKLPSVHHQLERSSNPHPEPF